MIKQDGMSRRYNECEMKPGPSSQPPPLSTSGRIRLFSPEGDRSALATISLETTAADLAKAYNVDAIYLQIGNLHIRKLSPSARALYILREFLSSLGHSENDIRTRGTELQFRHLLAFFLGRPILQPNSIARSEILIANCDVRRGRLVHRWSRQRCLLYNGSIRIQKENGEDDAMSLSRCRVDVCETRHGRCLRVQHSASVVLLHFDKPEVLALWLTKCRQSGQRNVCDLSDRKLTLLPESLLCSEADEVEQLNLRRNSLSARNNNEPSSAQLGWLDDLSRLTSLTSLDLSSNRLAVFPTSITQLPNLQKLNLSSNCIQTIPPNVRLLRRLASLDMENNWLSSLPIQLVECDQLVWLNLRFNRIKQVPEETLTNLPHLREWALAGNYIESLDVYRPVNIMKLDLRRSSLSGCFRLPSGCFDHLTFLDIRDNCKVSTVHLTNIPSLQVLHCERLQLTSLHLNGQSLTHLYAQHNMLDCLIVMPVPLHLVFIDVSHNKFDVLPDWIGDLSQIDCLRVNNNRLTSLPDRLFSVQSMRYLFCKNNRLKALPPLYDNCNLISCVLYSNQLEELPSNFLRKGSRLRHLNVSFNRLTGLPAVNAHHDRNRINTLRLSHNRLDESIVPILMKMRKLKILDLSHNRLRYFDDSALGSLTMLEELNLSSNELTTLSSSIFDLPALQILKAHSNRIKAIPDLSVSPTLQTVDISNNALGAHTSSIATGPALKQLDLTCNPALNLNSGTLRRTHKKPVALYDIGAQSQDRVQVGFSETSGNRNKLCIRRVHCGDIFGMVDGSSNYELPKTIQTILNQLLL
ncbi:hypothetical protein V3C99_002365, partial [Haemonchus contortus]